DIRKSLGNAQRANSPEGRVVLYLDACFTGSSGAGWIAAETSSVRISPSAIRAAEPRVVELAASGSDQEANWDRERRLGIFTDALVEGLYGAADLDRDGHVTAAELSAFLARRIDHRVTRLFPSPRRYQTPSLSGDGAARLASISASTPSRDPEATARLAVRCATVPKSSDAAEVREFLGNCGAECPCLPALEVRLRELETAATACRVEGEELERLTKRGSAARAQIEALAASATCAEVKARAVGVISGIATAPPGTPPTPEARQPSRIVPPAPPPARGESRVSVKSVVRVRQPFTVPGCGIVIVPTRTARHLGQQVYEGGIAVDGKNMLVRTGTLLTPLSPSGGCKLFVVLRPSGDIELDGECSCSDPSAPPSPGTSAPTPSGTSAPSKFFRDNRLDHTSCTECPEMAVIPVGTFVMGTVEAAGQTERSELPARKISFTKSFALGRHEVTFDEWDACVATKMCTLRPADEGWGRGRQPVVNVTANAISEYLTFLAAITGQSYRLPTEAEWEYAARAGAATRFSTGDTLTAKDANVERSRGRAVPVGSYAANAFGLFDMHGNVWEIVAEC
ncbi:MAG TPA: SUMF1/EgtB/PvdO family nonheme iron enzyme, partial [Hyphomicrobiaceae bacterium]|nr:SUMF1/EgtB/PvdO family nonheme iron enzyme [Hyphomicrobiaceae bacterium]